MIIPKKHAFLLFFALLLSLAAAAKSPVRQTREEYIDRYKSLAIDHMERYGIPASISMAQGILESDCGNSRLAQLSNNHFGIKCKNNWQGERVYYDDDAKGECFRAYDRPEDSWEDHAEFLDRQPRYDSLFVYASDDYKSWARGLKACGYATDPSYTRRLIRIIEENKLYLLDREGGAALYADATDHTPSDEWFAAQSNVEEVTVAQGGIDLDNYRVSVKKHNGYGVYRTNGVLYVVAGADDSYETIGRAFRISAGTLRKFNDVAPDTPLIEGELVYLGRKQKAWTGEATTHTVREGETIWSVAQHYGLRAKSLRKLNRYGRGDELLAGAVIRIQ